MKVQNYTVLANFIKGYLTGSPNIIRCHSSYKAIKQCMYCNNRLVCINTDSTVYVLVDNGLYGYYVKRYSQNKNIVLLSYLYSFHCLPNACSVMEAFFLSKLGFNKIRLNKQYYREIIKDANINEETMMLLVNAGEITIEVNHNSITRR